MRLRILNGRISWIVLAMTVAGVARFTNGADLQTKQVMIGGDDDSGAIYIHADAGPLFLEPVTFRFYGAHVIGDFKTGARGDIAIGYNLSDSFALELETGALWNRWDTAGVRTTLPMDLFQVPVLGNAIYKIHLNNRWTADFGIGAGADVATLVYTSETIGLSAVTATRAYTDVTFAYQAQAGMAFALSSNADVDLGYKFFGSFDHHWNFEGEGVSSDAVFTHALLLSFCWKF
jgi:hypothetical protein